jgi:hypothetical protein
MSRRHIRAVYRSLTTLTSLTLLVLTPAAGQVITRITEVEGITE